MKIISVNIEGDKHLDKLLNFFLEQKPDLICLSEIFEEDLSFFASKLELVCIFAHECYRQSMFDSDQNLKTFGIAILAKKIIWSDTHYLTGEPERIPRFRRSLSLRDRSHHIAVPAIIAKIEVNSEYYFITNTHLAVTANGEAANYQIKQAENLLSLLGSFSDMIVCGDLNAPRGGEVFNLFKNVYQDNIPAEYETSLDQSLHRVKGLKFVVDHILSTKNYSFTNVVLVDGVSDHMAVVGEVASLNKDILSRLRNLLGYYS